MDTKRPFFKFIIPFLVAVLAFVYFAQPISAKADSATLSYQTTSMSLQEVKLFISAGSAATISVTLVILGFISLTYCTLRNVQVPVQFSSKQSFFDKCKQVGQYMLDNATDSIKDVLFSVYSYCQDNGITSPIGLSKFLMVNAIKFFGAISKWLSSSFVSNVNTVSSGFIGSFDTSADLLSYFPLSTYNFSFFTTYSDVIPTSGFVYKPNSSVIACTGFAALPSFDYSSICAVCFDNGFAFYTLADGSLTRFESPVFQFSSPLDYYNRSNVTWYTSGVIRGNSDYSLSNYYFFGTFLSACSYTFLDFYSFILTLNCGNVYVYDGIVTSAPASLSVSSLTTVKESIVTSISDTVYVPTDDEIELDPDGVADDLVGAAAGALTLDYLIKLLTQDRALTLTSALPDSSRVNGAGTYAFPDFSGIWKYPRYFFNTLGSWLLFVGGCLNAVTVGEGGLSWLFYGGFVFLICGGVIGKILLG